jgi:hypothetical protein
MAEAMFNDVFGRLAWDDRLGCWLGGIDWPPGRYTEVAIWHPDNDVAAGLRLAREGLEWLQDHEGHARRCVAGEMLEVYNGAWRGAEGPLTAGAFLRRLELVRVGFEEDGSLRLTYDGRDLFGGHVIDGEFGPDRSFHGAGLVG